MGEFSEGELPAGELSVGESSGHGGRGERDRMKQLSLPLFASPNHYFLDGLSPQPKIIFVQHFLIAMVQSAHSEQLFNEYKTYAYPRKNLSI